MKFLQTTCRSPTSNVEPDHLLCVCTAFPILLTHGATCFQNLLPLVIARLLHSCVVTHLLPFPQTARIRPLLLLQMRTRYTKNLVALQMPSLLVTTGALQLLMVLQFLNRIVGKQL